MGIYTDHETVKKFLENCFLFEHFPAIFRCKSSGIADVKDFLVEKFNIWQTSKKKDFARKHVFNVEYSDEFWITKKKSLTPFLHKKLLFQTVFCYLQFRTAPQYKGPFTLVIFAVILAAISSAILRRFQIARVNFRRGIASSLHRRFDFALEIAAKTASVNGP